jgi:transposase-like protein
MRKSIGVKGRAVVELLRGQKIAVEIASGVGCHPTLLKEWKERFLAGAPKIFETKKVKGEKKPRNSKNWSAWSVSSPCKTSF